MGLVQLRIRAPLGLDLDWRQNEKALRYGCIFSINPDAHSLVRMPQTFPFCCLPACRASLGFSRAANVRSLFLQFVASDALRDEDHPRLPIGCLKFEGFSANNVSSVISPR